MPEKKQRQNGRSKGSSKTMTDGLFNMLNPNNMLNNAQQVINSAVSVLEEEIAAGILAAKRIEKNVIDVDAIRTNPENLMNRIRKDTHEALDIFLDAFATLSKQLGILTDTVSKENEKQAATQSPQKKTENLQVIENDEPVKAGQKITLHISLNDDALTKPTKLDFHKTDFIGPRQQKIQSRYIQLKPATVLLKPGKVKEIAIQVTVPKNCKPGHYHSLLLITQMPEIKNVISLQVK
jgi:hypothetical protein